MSRPPDPGGGRVTGSSAPGEPGYDGRTALDDGAETGVLDAHPNPFGRPEDLPATDEDVPPELRARLAENERLLAEESRSEE